MSTTTAAISDALPSTVPKLEAQGLNWSTFSIQFTDAIARKGYWGHFNGSNPQPIVTGQPIIKTEPDPDDPTGKSTVLIPTGQLKLTNADKTAQA
ncbi:hypothetical protein CVT24_001137 [Panaeolus cyanescens]|uniref:Uncharacterized protein n=1 Tax=Panaeolus cyanescens TaxID=181874 RepID=A0A409YZ21_9AGAR|nr:hypothetical protein CVT24_001137 [Panaeolus cyanescens]